LALKKWHRFFGVVTAREIPFLVRSTVTAKEIGKVVCKCFENSLIPYKIKTTGKFTVFIHGQNINRHVTTVTQDYNTNM